MRSNSEPVPSQETLSCCACRTQPWIMSQCAFLRGLFEALCTQSKGTDWQQLHLRLLLCRELMTTERSITELEESDLLQYFSVDPQALPEAFPEHISLAALDMLPKSGCKGLQVKPTAIPVAPTMQCRHVDLPAAPRLRAHAEGLCRLHTHLLHGMQDVPITKLEWAHA